MRTTRARVVARAILALSLLLLLVAPAVRAAPAKTVAVWFIGFNTTLPPFDNVLVRQAVAYALDRGTIADVTKERMATGIEPPGCIAHDPNARSYAYDPGKARQLLAQAGVKLEDQGEVGLWVWSRILESEGDRDAVDKMLANLAAIGLRPRSRQFGNYNALKVVALQPVVKMSYWGLYWTAGGCSMGTFLEDLVHSKGTFNYFGFRDPALDTLIEKAIASGDYRTKQQLFKEAQQRALDAAVIIPIWWLDE